MKYQRQTAKVIKVHCRRENFAQKCQLIKWATAANLLNWLADSRKDDYYLIEEGMYEVLFGSQQPKAKGFGKYCCNEMFSHICKQLVDKMQEDHQKAIEKRDTGIQAIEYKNAGLQGEIRAKDQQIEDLIANRHVPRCGDFDNVLCFIAKNSNELHPYYVIRCQYKRLEKHKKWLRRRYPEMEVIDKCDDPNAIHRWCEFKREVIKKPNFYKNHFSLTDEKRELMQTLLDVTI